ncbi:PREDICTED: ABC transporter F family member 4-like [Nelumbo nucifera]|uniref:ABC transporter F family member 4-like n=1 Tax=Nelumbo nucifera TaxID=4432 RepID=A0A1U7ZYT4_NELNU|nr:PREDICTED: ABC transporter F family member 4-like [Nelumbo nucifera]
MRIRKRWPSQPAPPSSLPQLTPLAPDPPSSTPQPPLSSPLEPSPGSLHLHPDRFVETNNHHLRLPCDSPPNPSLTRPKLEDRHPSDLQLTMVKGANGWICSSSSERDESGQPTKKNKVDCMHPGLTQDSQSGEVEEEAADDRRFPTVTNRRNESYPGAATSAGVGNSSVSSSSWSRPGGRWCDGEKVFPLKKRRGDFERKVNGDTMTEKEKKMKSRVKTKTNKKWVHQQVENEDEQEGEEEDDDEKEEVEDDDEERKYDRIKLNGTSLMKKRGNSGVLMEGSRCSRVNGRGWRCCQQTLVGYSLCEHHLGKGRLRSMSSVPCRASAVARPKKEKERGLLSSSSSSSTSQLHLKGFKFKEELEEEYGEEEDEEEEEDKPLTITKKRKKIGMVKARSISSLLGQTYHAPAPPVNLQPSTSITTTDTISNNVIV